MCTCILSYLQTRKNFNVFCRVFTGVASEPGHEYDCGPTSGAGHPGVENPLGAVQRTSAHGLSSSRNRRLLPLRWERARRIYLSSLFSNRISVFSLGARWCYGNCRRRLDLAELVRAISIFRRKRTGPSQNVSARVNAALQWKSAKTENYS